jgi:hypothetical protein
MCVICGSHNSIDEDSSLLVYNTVSIGKSFSSILEELAPSKFTVWSPLFSDCRDPEDEGTKLLQDISICSPINIASYPKRIESLYSL